MNEFSYKYVFLFGRRLIPLFRYLVGRRLVNYYHPNRRSSSSSSAAAVPSWFSSPHQNRKGSQWYLMLCKCNAEIESVRRTLNSIQGLRKLAADAWVSFWVPLLLSETCKTEGSFKAVRTILLVSSLWYVFVISKSLCFARLAVRVKTQNLGTDVCRLRWIRLRSVCVGNASSNAWSESAYLFLPIKKYWHFNISLPTLPELTAD